MTYKKCIAFIYSLWVRVWSRAIVHLWTPEDNFQESVLPFSRVGPRDLWLGSIEPLPANPGMTFKPYLSIL